jgi:Domain of unknown function (DUF5122) beta-propeller
LDDSFGLRGVATFPKTFGWRQVTAIAAASDGKVVTSAACFSVNSYGGVGRPCIARYLPSGVLDTSFGVAGNAFVPIPNGVSWNLSLASSDKIVVPGNCGTLRPYCLMRLKGGPYPASACTLNADANNSIAASTDAMLVTRYLLGFQGEALTNGATGQNATRTAEEIVTYLETLKNDPARKLDLDGDGQSLAFTDGLLMLRAMLGLSGDALTVGAMGQTSVAYPTLRNPQQILQWIEATHGVACLP